MQADVPSTPVASSKTSFEPPPLNSPTDPRFRDANGPGPCVSPQFLRSRGSLLAPPPPGCPGPWDITPQRVPALLDPKALAADLLETPASQDSLAWAQHLVELYKGTGDKDRLCQARRLRYYREHEVKAGLQHSARQGLEKHLAGYGIKSVDFWFCMAKRLHANSDRGMADQHAAQEALFLNDNNKAGVMSTMPRVSRPGRTRPDTVGQRHIVEFKSIRPSRNEGTILYDSEQLKAQRAAAVKDGKTHTVVIIGELSDSRLPLVHPSKPLGEKSQVFFFDVGRSDLTHVWSEGRCRWSVPTRRQSRLLCDAVPFPGFGPDPSLAPAVPRQLRASARISRVSTSTRRKRT